MKATTLISCTVVASFIAAICLWPARGGAETAEEFYRGKQIVLLVASGIGGGYDTYARVFARNASRHIPGNPAIIPKNLPAAGGLTAANTLYSVAAKDGLTIAALTNGVAMDPLFGNPGARFDARKFNWLGSIGKLQNVCATWHESPIKTIADARNRAVMVGAAGPTSNTTIVPNVLNALLGTRFKVVSGYDSGTGLNLALESREVEGICGLSWSTLLASRPDWVVGDKLNVIVQMGIEKLLPKVPSALDLVTDPASRQVLELVLVRQEMGRPFATPPGVPPERVAALRQAFDATMTDPEFLGEAQRFRLEIDPLPADRISQILATAYGAPTDIVARAAALIEPAGRQPR